LLTLIVLACGGGDGDSEPTPGPTEAPTSGPEAALRQYVEANLQRQFVPDCSRADVAADVNKICAAQRGERNNQRAYVIGPTFSEFTQWVFVEDRGNGVWVVVGNQPMTSETNAVPGIPWPLRQGAEVVVVAPGDPPRLNVREGPGTGQRAVDALQDGARITLAAGPVPSGGYTWWQVAGRAGWVAGEFLRYPDALQ
jgi:hypothetical protein